MIPDHTLPYIRVELLSEVQDHDFALLLDVDITLSLFLNIIGLLLRATKSGCCVHTGSRWLLPLTDQNSILGQVIFV